MRIFLDHENRPKTRKKMQFGTVGTGYSDPRARERENIRVSEKKASQTSHAIKQPILLHPDEPPPPEHAAGPFCFAAEVATTTETLPADEKHAASTRTYHRVVIVPATTWQPLEPMKWDPQRGQYLFTLNHNQS